MKSSLRKPRYGACEELMRQQLDESIQVRTMSMDLSIDLSISCSSEDDGSEDERTWAVFKSARRNEEYDLHDDSGSYVERGHDTDGRLQFGCEEESDFDSGWSYFDADGVNETEPDKNAESAVVYGEIASLVEAPWNEEQGAAKDIDFKSRRRHRSKGERRSSSRDSGGQRSKERRCGRGPAAPHDLETSFVGGLDEEASALSFTGEYVPASNRPRGCQSEQRSCQSSREENNNSIAEQRPKINTNEYDVNGRCVRHPQVRLCKKTLFGGWKMLMSVCPNCCLQELHRIHLAGEHKDLSTRRQERSQDCRPRVHLNITRRSTSQNSCRDTATPKRVGSKASLDHAASLTTNSSRSRYQNSVQKEQVAAHSKTKKEKKEKEKRKENKKRSNSKHRHHRHGALPKQQPQTQDRAPRTCAPKMRYAGEDKRPGIYEDRINASFLSHDQDVMVNTDNGSVEEGTWEDGRRQPHGTGDGSR